MHSSLGKQLNQTGFTLVEILVSVVILSITLLGMAGLQLSGLRNSATSSYRTDATQLAYDIADSMRANQLAIEDNIFEDVDGAYSASLGSSASSGTSCIQTAVDDSASFCSPDDMAFADLSVWINRVKNKLPNATVSIQCNDLDPSDADPCTEMSTHTVTIRWDENNDGATVNNAFSYTFLP